MDLFAFLTAIARILGGIASTSDRLLCAVADALAAAVSMLGALVRLAHTGRVQQYLVFALIGIAAAAAWLASS